jgi:hypothetical protein
MTTLFQYISNSREIGSSWRQADDCMWLYPLGRRLGEGCCTTQRRAVTIKGQWCMLALDYMNHPRASASGIALRHLVNV